MEFPTSEIEKINQPLCSHTFISPFEDYCETFLLSMGRTLILVAARTNHSRLKARDTAIDYLALTCLHGSADCSAWPLGAKGNVFPPRARKDECAPSLPRPLAEFSVLELQKWGPFPAGSSLPHVFSAWHLQATRVGHFRHAFPVSGAYLLAQMVGLALPAQIQGLFWSSCQSHLKRAFSQRISTDAREFSVRAFLKVILVPPYSCLSGI